MSLDFRIGQVSIPEFGQYLTTFDFFLVSDPQFVSSLSFVPRNIFINFQTRNN